MFVAIAFLSLLEVILACSPLPAGQEKHLFLQITHMDNIPVQFAWGKAAIGVAATENDAKKNLKQAVKKAIVQTVKQEAKAAGVEQYATDLGTQFKPTIYYYPLHCDNKIKKAKNGNEEPIVTCAAKTVDWCCNATTNNMIDCLEIPGQTNAIDPITPVPEPYQQLIVDLSIGNAIVAGWTREQWAIKMANVEQNLRNNKDYGEAFRSVSVKVL